MTLKAVGVVRSAIGERKLMPVWGAPASVEIDPAYAGGLLRFEKHTHVWVLGWMEEVDRGAVVVKPRGTETPHGVFAVRSPARPNPVGLTCARVLAVRETGFDVDRLDFIDGTPVIDVKPYFVSRDCVFAARNAQVGRNADAEALRESLTIQALAFTGEDSGELRLAVEVLAHFRGAVAEFHDPESWSVVVPSRRHRFVDALMGMTHALAGREELTFHDRDTVVFSWGGARYEYELGPEGEQQFRYWPH
jgi:tRNA-Thr(GGU) m(6)t(6)A37 methyltransferase TsaA